MGLLFEASQGRGFEPHTTAEGPCARRARRGLRTRRWDLPILLRTFGDAMRCTRLPLAWAVLSVRDLRFRWLRRVPTADASGRAVCHVAAATALGAAKGSEAMYGENLLTRGARVPIAAEVDDAFAAVPHWRTDPSCPSSC
eukprot:COSAG05_NODE_106_length_18750_cov_677.083105_2_plen_141_part_00